MHNNHSQQYPVVTWFIIKGIFPDLLQAQHLKMSNQFLASIFGMPLVEYSLVNWMFGKLNFVRVLSLNTNLIGHFLFYQGYKIPWPLAIIEPNKNLSDILSKKWSNSKFFFFIIWLTKENNSV